MMKRNHDTFFEIENETNNIYTLTPNSEVKDGMSILFIAGVHGNELSSIALARSIYKSLKDDDIDGYDDIDEYLTKCKISKITIAPCVNFEAVRSSSRNIIQSNQDLNRAWSTQRLVPRNTITELIRDHDIIVDLHSSPNCANMFYFDVKQKGFMDYIKFCDKTKCIYAVSDSYNDSIKSYACQIPNKIGFTWEMPGMNTINYNAVLCARSYFINNFLYEIVDFVKSHTFDEYVKNKYRELFTSKTIVANSEGIYKACCSIGDTIKNNDDIIYKMCDINNCYQEDVQIVSPYSGVIIASELNSYIKPGEFLVSIQPKIPLYDYN